MGVPQVLRIMLSLPVPLSLSGFAWAVKIEYYVHAIGWLALFLVSVYLVIHVWRVIR